MAFLIALAIAAALAGGGALASSAQKESDKKNSDAAVDYLAGNSNQLPGYSSGDMWSDIAHNTLGSPLTGAIYDGVNSGDFKQALGTLLTGGISGVTTAINNRNYQKDLETIANGIDLSNFKGFTNNELEALLNYYTDEKGAWFWKHNDIDEAAFLRDYNDYLNWKDIVGDRPQDIDYDALYANADAAVDAEARGIMDLYNENLNRTTGLLNEQLADNNAMFSDYRNQILTNEAMANQAIAGSARYELDRQKRMAISRGASAAQRLVTNINTQLGLQAQAAQQSLNTSNALAQQLLAHRQAQAGLRQDYINAQNAFTDRQASLMNGMFERKQNARATAGAEAKQRYNDAMDQWERRLSAYGGDSPYVDFFRNSQYRTDNGKSTYGYNAL